MNLSKWTSRFQLNERDFEKMLWGLLLLLSVGVAVKTIGCFLQRRSIAGTISQSGEFLEAQSGQAKEYLQAYGKKAEKIGEKGAFCIEKKETPPQVTGILGDSVLLSGKWCKVNEEHSGAKVLKIETTQVTILWKEKEMKLAPLLASNPDSTVRPSAKDIKPAAPLPAAAPPTAGTAVAVQPAKDDPLAWLGRDISEGLRSFLLKLFEIMPAGEAERAKQEWSTLSDDEKQQRLDEVQKMIDSGQADMMLEQIKAGQG